MPKDFEPTEPQQAILSELSIQSRKREESIDLVFTEKSNDSVHGFFYEVDAVSQTRELARKSGISNKEICRAILRGISKEERRYFYLSNNETLTPEEIEELASEFRINLF